MYHFVDTNDCPEGVILPSEALRINGEYIENLIDGYRTLHISGREALSPDISEYETGIRDGSRLKNKRYPSRVITVTYQIIAADSEAFRAAYNKLGRVLNVKSAELIFNDESDKFYLGTPAEIGAVEPGRNAVVGDFNILCTDPFKYSLTEYEAELSTEELNALIDYHGTYKAFPTLEADFYKASADDSAGAGDCGYVSFFNDAKKSIQFGNPDETDGSNAYEKSQTLIDQEFLNSLSWVAGSLSWAVNNGSVFPADVQQIGEIGMSAASYGLPILPKDETVNLIDVWTSSGSPLFRYSVIAKAFGRMQDGVKLNVSITAALKNDSSYFGVGLGLMGSLYIGGEWHNVTVKQLSENWRGRDAHTVNATFTITGIEEATSVLSGIKFKVERTDNGRITGALPEKRCADLPINIYAENTPAAYYLTAKDYGTIEGKWHGASATRRIQADESGELGAANFVLSFKHKMSIGESVKDVNQLGAFQVQVTTLDGANVAGVRIYKGSAGKSGFISFYVNGLLVASESVDLSYENEYFSCNPSVASVFSITKSGAAVNFNIGGIKKSFTLDEIADLKADKVTFMFEQYSDSPALSYNGLYQVKFVKNNCNTFNDIPNKFGSGDVLKVDCRDGSIYLNGTDSPEYGAVMNDWENFYLTPGINQISAACSGWVPDEYKPKFKVRYREVFL